VVLYSLFSWSLVVITAVTLVWPLNVPLLALACKVRQGRQPIDMEPKEFWTRSTFGALGLAGFTLVLLGLVYVLVVSAELPRHIVHLVLFMAYLPVGVWYLFWIYALEDLLQGLSVFMLYFLLPLLPLLVAGRVFRVANLLERLAPWLLPAT